jgi:uncharacterized protein YqkB
MAKVNWHPKWEECKRHRVQSDSMKVINDMTGVNPTGKLVYLQVNCEACGCPGAIVLELPTAEVEWGPEALDY